jgi:hypothetical protein
MDAASVQVPIFTRAVRGRARRGRFRPDMDGRSSASLRIKKLMAVFVAELGGSDAASPTMMLKIRRAAELTVACEELRASTLSAEHPPTDLAMLALVRLEGIADRATRALGLGVRKPEPAVPTLAEHLAKRAAETSVIPPSR